MLKKDNIWLGIGMGLAVPVVGYALLLMFFEQLESAGIMSAENMSANFRERTIALVAVAFNLIPLSYYSKLRCINTMRGFVFPTLIFVMIWFWKYGRPLIGLE